MTTYTYTKTPVALDRLTDEIRTSSITIALDNMTLLGDQLSITFKADLSTEEKSTLDTIVANHSGLPLPSDDSVDAYILSQPPFGDPDYRTRWDAKEGEITCTADSSVSADFQLTALRSSFGGDIVGTGFELGDWITACIYDKDSVIPEAYRAATCEAWPVVKTYIYRQYLPANGAGLTVFDMDTKPLVAELSVGLYIRTTLNTVDAGNTRKFYCNFKLLEKL